MTVMRAGVAATYIAISMLGLAGDRARAAEHAYLWRARPLYVFAGSEQDPRLQKQRAIVAGAEADLGERDVVVIFVVGARVTRPAGAAAGNSADDLRRSFSVPANAFRAILVGKDGGVKLSSPTPLTSSSLRSLIDAMPMRRDEMRRRARAG